MKEIFFLIVLILICIEFVRSAVTMRPIIFWRAAQKESFYKSAQSKKYRIMYRTFLSAVTVLMIIGIGMLICIRFFAP